MGAVHIYIYIYICMYIHIDSTIHTRNARVKDTATPRVTRHTQATINFARYRALLAGKKNLSKIWGSVATYNHTSSHTTEGTLNFQHTGLFSRKFRALLRRYRALLQRHSHTSSHRIPGTINYEEMGFCSEKSSRDVGLSR